MDDCPVADALSPVGGVISANAESPPATTATGLVTAAATARHVVASATDVDNDEKIEQRLCELRRLFQEHARALDLLNGHEAAQLAPDVAAAAAVLVCSFIRLCAAGVAVAAIVWPATGNNNSDVFAGLFGQGAGIRGRQATPPSHETGFADAAQDNTDSSSSDGEAAGGLSRVQGKGHRSETNRPS